VRPHKRGAHADGVHARPCPEEGPDVLQPCSPKVNESDLHRGRLSRGGSNSVQGPPYPRSGPLAPPAGALKKGAPTPTAWMRGPAQRRARPRYGRPPEGGRLRFAPGPPTQRRPKQCPGAALPKRRPSRAAGGRPHERGAHADGVGSRPCPAEGRAAIQPSSPKVADLCHWSVPHWE